MGIIGKKTDDAIPSVKQTIAEHNEALIPEHPRLDGGYLRIRRNGLLSVRFEEISSEVAGRL